METAAAKAKAAATNATAVAECPPPQSRNVETAKEEQTAKKEEKEEQTAKEEEKAAKKELPKELPARVSARVDGADVSRDCLRFPLLLFVLGFLLFSSPSLGENSKTITRLLSSGRACL